MRKLPYKVIGTYHPVEGATPKQIGHDLVKIVADAGYYPMEGHGWDGATWHSPSTGSEVRRSYTQDSSSRRWHQDSNGMDVEMALWASQAPTQVRYKWGRKIYAPQPFEVVVVNNTSTKHKGPPAADCHGRLFFRQYVTTTPPEPEYDAEGLAS